MIRTVSRNLQKGLRARLNPGLSDDDNLWPSEDTQVSLQRIQFVPQGVDVKQKDIYNRIGTDCPIIKVCRFWFHLKLGIKQKDGKR